MHMNDASLSGLNGCSPQHLLLGALLRLSGESSFIQHIQESC